MRRFHFAIWSALGFAVFILSTQPVEAQSCPLCAKLEIKVKGLRNQTGVVRILMSKDKKNFEESDPEKINLSQSYFRNAKATRDLVFIFRELPAGQYAFKIFHDENSNEMIDTTLLGKPTEGIAISNQIDVKGAKILFENASFELKPRSFQKKVATLQYLKIKN